MSEFSHLDNKGNIRMVDVTNKVSTTRVAKAEGRISMNHETLSAIQDDTLPKGNVLTTAKVSGIQAAKRTAELIPMCHQLNLAFVDIEFEMKSEAILIRSVVKSKEATGLEMEALLAVSATALTIYDMCKAVDKNMVIGEIKLLGKIGGKSDYATEYRPKVGIITLSDGVAGGTAEDQSGLILKHGFKDAGCHVANQVVFEDGSEKLVPTIHQWIDAGIELVLTTGGTGLGPRDLTIQTVNQIYNSRLPGIEQALHAYGRGKINTAILSRLTAGIVNDAIVICLPGSPGAVKDALHVLIPTIFHSFHMMQGQGH